MQMFEPADNIDLLAVVQEWEEYYEMRFARKPKLARSHVDTHRPDWPVRQRRRSGCGCATALATRSAPPRSPTRSLCSSGRRDDLTSGRGAVKREVLMK